MAALSSKSTADNVLSHFGNPDLTGRTILITGSQGLGLEAARALSSRNATIVLASRSLDSCQTGVAHIVAANVDISPGAPLPVAMRLDLADTRSIAQFVTEFKAQFSSLHVLICNAGVLATPQEETVDGFDLQMGINHFGHFYLTQLLLPLLRSTSQQSTEKPRVIVVSSAAHTRGNIVLDDLNYRTRQYNPGHVYGSTKLCNILFTRELARCEPSLTCVCLHPGVIMTELFRHMGARGSVMKVLGKPFIKTVPQGAATHVYAVLAPELEALSGCYLVNCAVSKPRHKQALDDKLAGDLWSQTEAELSSALKKRLSSAGEKPESQEEK